MGHVGLMPQSVNTYGGFRVQENCRGRQVIDDARAVSDAGVSMVVEGVMEPVAREITNVVPVPTIGIGASAECDGQVLVSEDLLGLFSDFTPKFVKRYAELGIQVSAAAAAYAEDPRPPFPRCRALLWRAENRRCRGTTAQILIGVSVSGNTETCASKSMRIIRTAVEMRDAVEPARNDGAVVGLVPTMGALHAGHLALVRRARRDCGLVVASLFVNPTQFSANEDFDSYPRDEAHDLELLERNGVDIVYAPTVAEMYPDGFGITVTVTGLTEGLCGASGPVISMGSRQWSRNCSIIAGPTLHISAKRTISSLKSLNGWCGIWICPSASSVYRW